MRGREGGGGSEGGSGSEGGREGEAERERREQVLKFLLVWISCGFIIL